MSGLREGPIGNVWYPSSAGGTQRKVSDKLNDFVSSSDGGSVGGGVSNDGTAMRALISGSAAGSTIIIKSGTYLLNQDGANPWCINFSKRAHLIFEPGVIFKATTNGVRAVVRVSSAITHEGAPVIDGDSKTNHAVEVVVGAKGTTFRKWEGKNVTQAFSTALSAAPFSVVSEVGIIFDDCYAHHATAIVNAVVGDTPGTARGFHFYGTAPEFGVNAVINSRVDTIINNNGLAGNYEDEDGIVSQMTGSFFVCENNTLTNCMKRGVKMQDRGIVRGNQVISSRTGVDNALETTTRMYSGISVYSDDVLCEGNRIGSGTSFGLVYGGSFNMGIEAGGSGQSYARVQVTRNNIQIGTSSNARGVEFIRLWGALLGFQARDNVMEVASGPTITNVFGIRSDFDHATLRATVDISGNVTKNTTYPMQLKGGFSGLVSVNRAHDFSGGLGGIVVDTSASALRPANVSFVGNTGHGVNDFTVRINDTAATGISVTDTKTESTTGAAVSIAAGVRAYEHGSSGGIQRPARIFDTAPPTTGTWVRSDSVMNRDPRAASPVVEWRCTVSGTPGTWQAAGWLTTKGVTASRPTLTANDIGVQYIDTTIAKVVTWDGSAWV